MAVTRGKGKKNIDYSSKRRNKMTRGHQKAKLPPTATEKAAAVTDTAAVATASDLHYCIQVFGGQEALPEGRRSLVIHVHSQFMWISKP